MKLIVGLGNPENKYDHTRHNVGFFMLDEYAKSRGVSFQPKDKFKSVIAEFDHDGDKVLLVKPQTYYNLSGEAVRAIADFYKIQPDDVLIIHDELALPFGTIRTRIGGSDAGNNGVKSINQHMGEETARIRVGIYNEFRDTIDDAHFVLSNFSKDEQVRLDENVSKITALIDSFIQDRFQTTTHK